VPATLTFPRDPATLEKLGKLYVEAFLVMTAFVVFMTLQSGYDRSLAFVALDTAAVGCLLLRLARRPVASNSVRPVRVVASEMPAQTFVVEAPPRELGLLTEVDRLLDEGERARGLTGVMVVSILANDPEGASAADVSKLVRNVLHRNRSSGTFQLTDRLLAVAASRPDVVHHFYNLSSALQKDLRSRVAHSDDWQDVRITAGIAVAESESEALAAELVDAAASAVRLAEDRGRQVYFSRL
jgi:hypothetical protein